MKNRIEVVTRAPDEGKLVDATWKREDGNCHARLTIDNDGNINVELYLYGNTLSIYSEPVEQVMLDLQSLSTMLAEVARSIADHRLGPTSAAEEEFLNIPAWLRRGKD